MQITTSTMQGRVPVAVLHLDGNLDASNFTDVIQKSQELYDSGARDLLIDLSKVPYISSAGLMSIHTLSLIFTGQSIQTGSSGRTTFRSLNPGRDKAAREHVKMLGLQKAVSDVFEMVGLKEFFETFDDIESAVKSF
jgi:anti-anti-sigma regulatory factor